MTTNSPDAIRPADPDFSIFETIQRSPSVFVATHGADGISLAMSNAGSFFFVKSTGTRIL